VSCHDRTLKFLFYVFIFKYIWILVAWNLTSQPTLYLNCLVDAVPVQESVTGHPSLSGMSDHLLNSVPCLHVINHLICDSTVRINQ
jgi:hypothetical protein